MKTRKPLTENAQRAHQASVEVSCCVPEVVSFKNPEGSMITNSDLELAGVLLHQFARQTVVDVHTQPQHQVAGVFSSVAWVDCKQFNIFLLNSSLQTHLPSYTLVIFSHLQEV